MSLWMSLITKSLLWIRYVTKHVHMHIVTQLTHNELLRYITQHNTGIAIMHRYITYLKPNSHARWHTTIRHVFFGCPPCTDMCVRVLCATIRWGVRFGMRYIHTAPLTIWNGTGLARRRGEATTARTAGRRGSIVRRSGARQSGGGAVTLNTAHMHLVSYALDPPRSPVRTCIRTPNGHLILPLTHNQTWFGAWRQ